jgi:hypothetical protein
MRLKYSITTIHLVDYLYFNIFVTNNEKSELNKIQS